jgi:hypothetical protein
MSGIVPSAVILKRHDEGSCCYAVGFFGITLRMTQKKESKRAGK